MKQDVQTKAEELSVKHNCKVTPIVFHDEEKNEDIIGFMRMPSRNTKMRMLDKAMTAPLSGAGELFEAVLIIEESDPRFLSEDPECDKYYAGGATAAFAMVEIAVNTFKKK